MDCAIEIQQAGGLLRVRAGLNTGEVIAGEDGYFGRAVFLAARVAAEASAGQILIRILGQRGFILGQNLAFESRGALGDVAKLPALIAELKAHQVDAIVIVGYLVYAVLAAGFVVLLVRRRAELAPLLLIVVVFPVFYFVSPYTWLQSEPRR